MSALVLAATALLSGWTDYAMAKVDRVGAFQGLADRPPRSPGTNVLLVGSDRRAGLSARMREKLHVGNAPGRRSDTMILAHISAGGSRATLVSLPRDWYVTIPAHTSDSGERVPAQKEKLNAAFALGGANLTVATVEENTGIRIDHYVEVSLLGFVEVVNAIGGVDVCVPKPVDDPKSGLTLPPGKSHLNGVRSLKYVRARKTLGSGGDLGRIDRQQKFLGAMMQQALSTNTLLNPMKFTDFLNAALAALTVDRKLSAGDLRRLALMLRDLDPQRVSFLTVPVADPSLQTEDGGVAVAIDEEKAEALFTRIRRDRPIGKPREAPSERQAGKPRKKAAGEGGARAPSVTIPPDRIEIEVYNDTRVAGLGARATRDLREVGFLIETPPRNADPPNQAERTVIQYGPNRGDSARTLAAALPGARLTMVPGLGDDIQVVVGSSYDGAREVQPASGSGGSDGPDDSAGARGSGASGSPGTKFNTRSAAANPCSDAGSRR